MKWSPTAAWFSALTLFALTSFSMPTTARSEEVSRVTYSDTVRVTASKVRSRLADLATTVNLVTPAQIRMSTGTRTQEVLASVPGAHVLDLSGSGSGGAVEARGFAAQGTTSAMLVLLDEIPLNDFETGRVNWNLISPAQVRRVEYMRGPSSFLYGSATMAGLVNIVTHTRGEGASQWAQVSGGSFGSGDAAAGASWSGARAQGSISASLQRQDGYRDHSESTFGTGYASGQFALGDAWSLRARVIAHSGEQEQPGSLSLDEWNADPTQSLTPDDYRNDHTYEGAAELTGRASPALELTLLAGGMLKRADASETVLFSRLDRTSDVNGAHAEARAHWMPSALGGLDLLVGGEVRKGSLESRYFDPTSPGTLMGAADVNRTAGGLFSLLRLPVTGGFSATGGARVDWIRANVDDPRDPAPRSGNDDLRAISPTAALQWSMPGHGQAWVSYAGAFKAPELEQLYDSRPYDLGFGPFLISNHGLRPQKDDHWEAGGRVRAGRAWIEGATYWARVRDEIGFDYGTFREENIARSRHFGIEAQVSMPPVQGLSGSLSFAWTRATFDGGDNDGKQINNVPERLAFARASYEHGYRGSVTFEVQHVSRQWVNEDNSTPLPDYTLLNAGLTQAAGPVELFGSVRNLADKKYATLGYVVLGPVYFPAAERSFSAGMRMRFGS